MARNTPTNMDDVIDSRDVIARIEELQDERAALVEAIESAQADYDAIKATDPDADRDTQLDALHVARADLVEWDDDGYDAEELAALKALAEEAEGCASDWHHGETLIRDSHFRDYAMELAEDIGAIPADATWPCTCIDWDQAARELQMDYSAVDFDGVTYWIR